MLNVENVEVQGSSPPALEVQKRDGTGLKRWKSLTRIFDSKKKSSPQLRQTTLAINVSFHLPVILPDPGFVLRMILYSPQIIGGFHTGCLRFGLPICTDRHDA